MTRPSDLIAKACLQKIMMHILDQLKDVHKAPVYHEVARALIFEGLTADEVSRESIAMQAVALRKIADLLEERAVLALAKAKMEKKP